MINILECTIWVTVGTGCIFFGSALEVCKHLQRHRVPVGHLCTFKITHGHSVPPCFKLRYVIR